MASQLVQSIRFRVSADQLSDSDQNWVKNRTEQDANPFRKRDDD